MSVLKRMKLSALGPQDAAGLAALDAQCHSHPWGEAAFTSAFEAGHWAYALRLEGQLIAYALMLRGVDAWDLLNITTAPHYRGAGHAQTLLKAGLTAAHTAGAQAVLLEVRPSNTAALGVYTKLGFTTLGRRKNYYAHTSILGAREDALVLAHTFANETSRPSSTVQIQ